MAAMLSMRMCVPVLMTVVNVAVIPVLLRAVRMVAHGVHSTRSPGASHLPHMLPGPAPLLGSLTRPFREFIDALAGDCDHEMSFPLRAS